MSTLSINPPQNAELSDKNTTHTIHNDFFIQVVGQPTFHRPNVLGLIHDDYYWEIQKYDWNTEVAYWIMWEESKGNPEAYNPERHNGCNGSFGLMQIACVHTEFYDHYTELYDPENNIKIAYEIWRRDGFVPWGVCKPPNQKVICW